MAPDVDESVEAKCGDSAADGAGAASSGASCKDKSDDLTYLKKYMDRMRMQHLRPAETPANLPTPVVERGVLEQTASEDDPKKRMEWQRMLRAVLESDVLSSETKRITASDSTPTPSEMMNRVWVSLHAMRVGHTRWVNDPDEELVHLTNQRALIIPAVVRDVCDFGLDATRMPTADEREGIRHDIVRLLDRVDYAENLFPSQRQLLAAHPEWSREPFASRLKALTAWHNVVREQQAQVRALHGWTGKLTHPDGSLASPIPSEDRELGDDAAAIERILRGNDAHQTFERRFLRRLNALVDMTRATLREHHTTMRSMCLPSLEPDVLPLVRFPMWLAEGALRQRLEYADKLKEPSLLLVESLSDDLRTVLAMACRIKAQYMQLTVSEPEIGWNLPLEVDSSFDSTVCSALHFFFRLLHFRLKSAPYFKEVDVLETEWDFLSSAVRVVPGGDVIVTHKMAGLVNRVFARIIAYFQREIQVPTAVKSTSQEQSTTPQAVLAARASGRSTHSRISMSVPDMAKWIQGVFKNTRVRSRRATGFAKRFRGLLETAAEYDLRALKRASISGHAHDLHSFLQTLLHADYFLVYTSSFEERGVFVLAEPELQDKPQLIQSLIFQCVRPKTGSGDDDSTPPTSATAGPPHPHYILFLTPREPFLWTGRVMPLTLPWIDVSLKEQRLRLIADGSGERLEECKRHLKAQFAPKAESKAAFPLTPVYERMSHLHLIQYELKLMTKAGYVLTETLIESVPVVRKQMLRLRPLSPSDRMACDDLVQSCFTIAFDQGARALGYIQSVRLHAQMSKSLAQLAVEWISFICDDCVLTERSTFRWAVAALEQAMKTTIGENIFLLSEYDFYLLRRRVSSCMALLISHFDILGARSHVLQEQESQRAQRRRISVQPDACIANAAQNERELSERRVAAVAVRDAEREDAMRERRLIGHQLDDTRLENRGLQLLASKGVQMRWQQGRFIGGGTFGTVYLAVNLDTGGLMAVKEIRFQELSSQPTFFQQIHDEMNVMEMLRHPNIVEYYGIEVHRDRVYIFEEYCQGGSLAQLLEHGRIEDEIVLQVYTLQMLDGLMYLHSKGVVHRDIKPENILLDHMGVIKFVDFGAAKVLSNRSRTLKHLTTAGGPTSPAHGQRAAARAALPGVADGPGQSLQGTPMYMSPEVVKSENKGREGCMDIWSLGCVILECARGQRPWSQLDNEWAIMFHIGMAQQHPQLPDESQLSALGIDFIKQCLTIDPFERPTAMELRQHAWIRALVDELNAENEREESQSEGTLDDADAPAEAVGDSSSVSEMSEASAAASAPESTDAWRGAAGADPLPAPLEPGIPDHRHPGYEALVADVQYRREEKQTKAMLAED